MTAEVVVMNKTAVAMAADSVVSVGQTKEYQSASKLFALRPDLPVGIMIYNAADFAMTPWEVVIKEYRNWFPAGQLETIDQYADSFLTFLASSKEVFSDDTRRESVREEIGMFYGAVRAHLDGLVKERIDVGATVTEGWVRSQFDQILLASIRSLDETEALEAHLPGYLDEVDVLVEQHAVPMMEAIFQNLLTARRRNRLRKIATKLLTKNCGRPHYSGIVIAGFGQNQMFPSAREFEMHLVTPDNVVFSTQRSTDISLDIESSIFPCAQRSTVDTFVTGLDPRLEAEISQGLEILFKEFTQKLVDRVQVDFTPDNSDAVDVLAEDFRSAGEALIGGLKNGLAQRSRAMWQQPVTRAVSVLPKDELANMAESLVNITSLRQRVSLTRETVGGPIDVCVISRAEGLVWINRKHYFQPELNPQFMSRFGCPAVVHNGGVDGEDEE